MKQFISVLLITIFFVMVSDATSIAQAEKNMFDYHPESSFDLFSLFNDKRYFVELRVNDVSIRAMRDFMKQMRTQMAKAA